MPKSLLQSGFEIDGVAPAETPRGCAAALRLSAHGAGQRTRSVRAAAHSVDFLARVSAAGACGFWGATCGLHGGLFGRASAAPSARRLPPARRRADAAAPIRAEAPLLEAHAAIAQLTAGTTTRRRSLPRCVPTGRSSAMTGAPGGGPLAWASCTTRLPRR